MKIDVTEYALVYLEENDLQKEWDKCQKAIKEHFCTRSCRTKKMELSLMDESEDTSLVLEISGDMPRTIFNKHRDQLFQWLRRIKSPLYRPLTILQISTATGPTFDAPKDLYKKAEELRQATIKAIKAAKKHVTDSVNWGDLRPVAVKLCLEFGKDTYETRWEVVISEASPEASSFRLFVRNHIFEKSDFRWGKNGTSFDVTTEW